LIKINTIKIIKTLEKVLPLLYLDLILIENTTQEYTLNESAPLILIVEDSSVNRRLCESLLNKNGYNTAVCSDGENAIEFLKTNSPDLILLDIVMPGIDGYEFCKVIKNNPKIKHTPIIFLSAMNDENSLIEGFKSGAVDFITKPFRHQELLARTKTHIELKRTKEKLLQMAITDELTGLVNRRYFMGRLLNEYERIKRYESIFTVMMIDLDFFKKINDTYGHQAGDTVLRKVSDTMKVSLRLSDIIGRIGGEEFAVILSETDIKDAMIIGERLRKKVEAMKIIHKEHTIQITISIGASQSSKDDLSIDDVLQRSDSALYFAKENGRNRIYSE